MTESIPAMIWDYLPGVLQGLTTGLVAWGWWSLKRVFVSRADFDVRRAATDARLDAIESRQYSRTTALQQIDFKLDALPTSDEVRGLAISVASHAEAWIETSLARGYPPMAMCSDR